MSEKLIDIIELFIGLFIQGIICYWIGYFAGRRASDEQGADDE